MRKNLVSTGEAIEREFGIPIVNKRISVTPIALVGGSCLQEPEDFVEHCKDTGQGSERSGRRTLSAAIPHLVSKGMTTGG